METINMAIITIIVPVYKVEKYLCRCLDSILNQDFHNYDVILIDDGSPDCCGEICDEYIELFAKQGISCSVIHQENGGLSEARNTGIEFSLQNSNSEWITFIDSDDWIDSHYLSILYRAAQKTNLDIVIGSYDRVKNKINEEQKDINLHPITISPEDFWISKRTNATVSWGKLYRKQCFKTIRFPVGKYHEDEYLTYKLLFRYAEVAFVDIPLYHYFVNEESIISQNYLLRFPDLREAIIEHIHYFKNSEYKRSYRLEIEKYAECLSEVIWLAKTGKLNANNEEVIRLRNELRAFLKANKGMILFENRKDIYIAAYPNHEFFIRVFGKLKDIISKGESNGTFTVL